MCRKGVFFSFRFKKKIELDVSTLYWKAGKAKCTFVLILVCSLRQVWPTGSDGDDEKMGGKNQEDA